MVRCTLLLLLANLCLSFAPTSVRSQDAAFPVMTTQDTIYCYIWTGKKNGRTRDFPGSGRSPALADACAYSKMIGAGYTERFGGDESCDSPACEGDISCPSYAPMALAVRAPSFTVDLDCYACDGTCVPVSGEGDTWCKAYEKARATAQRVSDYEGHGGIRCCRVVNVPACPPAVCPAPAKRCLFPWRR